MSDESERDAHATEVQHNLEVLREEVAAVLERCYGNSSFVVTFTCDGSAQASYVIGGDRTAALIALRGLMQPGPDVDGLPTASLIEAEMILAGDTYSSDVGWRTVDALAVLRRLK